MSVTQLALERNRVTVVAILTILIFGISTYIGMPRSEDPGFIVRTAVVTTQFPGASPKCWSLTSLKKSSKKFQS